MFDGPRKCRSLESSHAFGFDRVHSSQVGVEVLDCEGVPFAKQSVLRFLLRVHMVTSDDVTPLLDFSLESPPLRLLFLHDATLAGLTIGMLREMGELMFE